MRLGGEDVQRYEKIRGDVLVPFAPRDIEHRDFDVVKRLLMGAEKARLIGACFKAMKRLSGDLPEQRKQQHSELLYTRTFGYKEKDMCEHQALEGAVRKALLMR